MGMGIDVPPTPAPHSPHSGGVLRAIVLHGPVEACRGADELGVGTVERGLP